MSDRHYELPQGWSKAIVEEVCDDMRTGLVRSAKEQGVGREFPYVRMGDFDKYGRWHFDQLTRVDATECEAATYGLRAGDVLFNTRNSSELVGKVAIWPDGREGHVYNNNLLRMRFPTEIVSQFIGIQMQAPEFVARLDDVKSATTNVAALYQRDLNTRPLCIAPVAEQRRIVSKIESLQQRSGKAREMLAEVVPLLEQFRRSLLASAFRGDLTAPWRAAHPITEPASELLERLAQGSGKECDHGELPELPDTWKWVEAQDIVDKDADIRYGIVQPGPPLKLGIPYVRGVDIQDNEILTAQLWNTSEAIANQYRNSSLREGDVLLAIIRHLKVAIVPKELEGANMARTTARLRPSAAITTEFLAQALRSPFCQAWLKSNYRGGTSMPKVNIGDAIRLPIPVAPLAEQFVVCSMITNALKPMLSLVNRIGAIDSSLTQLDQSILSKAFRGALVAQDPSDEPASELLARICQQRELAQMSMGQKARAK